MSKKSLSLAALVPIVALVGCDEVTQPGIEKTLVSETQAHVIANQYIVVFKDDVTDPPGGARGMAVAHGLELRRTYSRVGPSLSRSGLGFGSLWPGWDRSSREQKAGACPSHSSKRRLEERGPSLFVVLAMT